MTERAGAVRSERAPRVRPSIRPLAGFAGLTVLALVIIVMNIAMGYTVPLGAWLALSFMIFLTAMCAWAFFRLIKHNGGQGIG